VLDVPDPLGDDPGRARAHLAQRARGRRAVLALGPQDVEQAVALALA
jgi:hypothetical protein